MKSEIYVSTDIETDGPIPGENSMLSFASVAFTPEGLIPGATFTRNLELLDDASPNPKTSIFWASHQEAYLATRENTVFPMKAMYDYRQWLYRLPGKPVFVAYPAGFDFTFIYWYLQRFTGECAFGFSALDMKTMAMTLLGRPYRESTKKVFPKDWFPAALPHTHVALDDALEQAEICRAMLDEAMCMRHAAKEHDRDQTICKKTADCVSTTVTESYPYKPGRFSCCEGIPGERSI